jgi:hypothetical protein
MKIIHVKLTLEELQNFNPEQLYAKMSTAGFKFDSGKIAGPWDRIKNPDGSVVYRQWQETVQ